MKANHALAYRLQSRVAVQLEARALAEKHYLRKWRPLETTPRNEPVPPRRVVVRCGTGTRKIDEDFGRF